MYGETSLDIVRGFIYEYENDTNAQTRYTLEELYGKELIEQYDSRDFDDYRTSKARARARGRGNQSVGSEQDSRIGTIGKGTSAKVKESRRLKPIDKDYLAVAVVRRTAQNLIFYLHNLTLKKDKPF